MACTTDVLGTHFQAEIAADGDCIGAVKQEALARESLILPPPPPIISLMVQKLNSKVTG